MEADSYALLHNSVIIVDRVISRNRRNTGSPAAMQCETRSRKMGNRKNNIFVIIATGLKDYLGSGNMGELKR